MANWQGGISGGSAVIYNDQPASSGGSSGGSGGGGGGTYTVNYEKPKEDIDDINAQLANAGKMLGRENANIAKSGKDALDNIKNQRIANNKQLIMKRAQLDRNSEWQPNQQKEQSVLTNLRRTMGNAAYGSGLTDLMEGLNRYDDMADVELINTWKENRDNAYNNWYQANADLISDYNEQATKTRSAFEEAFNNYLSNISNINAELGQKAYAKNGASGKISHDLDDDQGTISVDLLANNAIANNGMTNLLKMLSNKAKTDNPNIPNTNGLIDYIRPNNAVGNTKKLSNTGAVNLRTGAYAPTINIPGYNYQRENFNNYLIKK